MAERSSSHLWVSHFSGGANPARLFEVVKFRLDIILAKSGCDSEIYSSQYLKWFAPARESLFPRISYGKIDPGIRHLGLIPKTGGGLGHKILEKILLLKPLALDLGTDSQPIYVHRVITMFIKCFDFVPYFYNEKDGVKKSEDYKPFRFRTQQHAEVALAILNSSTFFYYFVALGFLKLYTTLHLKHQDKTAFGNSILYQTHFANLNGKNLVLLLFYFFY